MGRFMRRNFMGGHHRKRQIPESKQVLNIRNQGGFQLIEMIVAILIISLLMAGIVDSLAQVLRGTTATQNQTFAISIAQEIMDNARNSNWQTLMANQGTQTLMVKGVESKTGMFPRTLMPDYTASSFSSEGQNNTFRGNVRQTLTLVGPSRMRLDVNIDWPSDNAGKNRQMQVSTMISEHGIHTN